MFEKELQVLENLNDLTYTLSMTAGDLVEHGRDLTCDMDEFINSPDAIAAGDDTLLLNNMVRAERDCARDLVRFDRLLNQIITERLKLGDFTASF